VLAPDGAGKKRDKGEVIRRFCNCHPRLCVWNLRHASKMGLLPSRLYVYGLR